MSPQAQDPRWVAFADLDPPVDCAVNSANDTGAMLGRAVLVTNNLNATNACGNMANIWLAVPLRSARSDTGWLAFDDGDRPIRSLTHWLDPFQEKKQ